MKITRNGSKRPRETPTTLVEERKIQAGYDPKHGYKRVSTYMISGEGENRLLYISIPDEPAHERNDSTTYNYDITLSLNDLGELIKTLSDDLYNPDFRPAIRRVFGPHIGELLAIALAASDYQNVDFSAVEITQQEDDTLIDLGRRGTARLKDFFHYNLLNDPSFTEE